MFRALLHFLALLIVAGSALGQVYRWVDEKGVTHYGERPPQGVESHEVQDKLATPPAPGTQRNNNNWQEKDRELRQRKIQTDAAAEKKTQDDERRRVACNDQRDLLVRMKQAGRSYKLDAKGERVYLDDSERENTIARQEKIVAQYCQG